jgi:hypothetical protein
MLQVMRSLLFLFCVHSDAWFKQPSADSEKEPDNEGQNKQLV